MHKYVNPYIYLNRQKTIFFVVVYENFINEKPESAVNKIVYCYYTIYQQKEKKPTSTKIKNFRVFVHNLISS
jgi:hypothetical protein